MAIKPFLLEGLTHEMVFALILHDLHKLCHYPTIVLRALLLLGYCHYNIYCGLIILYYNAILILLYFWNMWCTRFPFAPHTYYICDSNNYFWLCWFTQTPYFTPTYMLHYFIIESGYFGAPKTHFCTTYKLNC